MDFITYFDDKKHSYELDFNIKEIQYCLGLDNFFNNVIKQHLDKLFAQNNMTNLKNWCKFIEEVCESNVPIYWIRKYENGKVLDETGKEYKNKDASKDAGRLWDTRRGALTLVIDEVSKEPKYGYIYVSNYDAQEIYNMIFQIANPNSDLFLRLLKNGEYHLHYDDGGSCLESQIAFYKQTGSVRGGVLTFAKWYFAHINDVNGEYYDENGNLVLDENMKAKIKELYPLGEVDKTNKTKWNMLRDWKTIDELSKGNNNSLALAILDKNINKDKRLRIIEKPLDIIENDKKLMQAHFLRFVHPFNYFLVPSHDFIYNTAAGNIGEFGPLINFVREKVYNEVCKDPELKDYYDKYLNNIMIRNSTLTQSILPDIHFLYGQKMKISKVLESLKEKGFIIDDNDLYQFDDSIDWSIKRVKFTYTLNNEKYEQFYNPQKEVEIADISKKLLDKYDDTGLPKNQLVRVEIIIENKTNNGSSIKGLKGKTTRNNGSGVGQKIKEIFTNLFQEGKLSSGMIDNLMDKKYCSENLKISYPVLSNIKKKRYYVNPIYQNYYLSSMWIDKHEKTVENWLNKNNLN